MVGLGRYHRHRPTITGQAVEDEICVASGIGGKCRCKIGAKDCLFRCYCIIDYDPASLPDMV